nr:hypothetical protein [Fimbriiglobus ruber]
MTLLCDRRIEELRGPLIMLVSQTQLERRLKWIHAAHAGTEARTSQRIYLPRLGTIVTVDGDKSRPHGEINVVCALNVHGHTHRRRVGNEWMRRVVSRHNDARPDRLLSQVIVNNLLLDTLHDVTPEETNHRQIHAGVHQSERIASSYDTVKRWQILESAAHDLNLGMRAELPTNDVAEFFAPIYENESHDIVVRYLAGNWTEWISI